MLPPEPPWGLWTSRQIVARIMDVFGPALSGTHVIPVDTQDADGRRVVGEWVYGAGGRALPRLSPEASPRCAESPPSSRIRCTTTESAR